MIILPKLLQHQKVNIMKEAAWAVSNVTAGNKEQIQAVINADIIKHLISVIIKVRLFKIFVFFIEFDTFALPKNFQAIQFSYLGFKRMV